MEREYLKITIVTPCFNMVDHIERTIQSVLSQAYPNLEYIVVDGGSKDGSVDIIKKYGDKLAHWVSEPDKGMYDAIQKGFNHSSGSVMGWLNADDELHPGSLSLLNKTFLQYDNCNWLTATNTIKDNEGRTVRVLKPFNTAFWQFLNREFIDRNNKLIPNSLIQQESTYWRRVLWDKVDGLNLKYKYAADFDLWMQFFKHERLWLSPGLIGAFRVRSGQLSHKHLDKYISESIDSLGSSLENLSRGERKRYLFYRWSKLTGLHNIPPIKQKIDWLTYQSVAGI